MTANRLWLSCLAVVALFIAASCGGATVGEVFDRSTPHEDYAEALRRAGLGETGSITASISSRRGAPPFSPPPTGSCPSSAPTASRGNVVWVWDPERGQSHYYAHLEKQAVSAGQHVDAGDVVGYVGNSGNARTTPPHLHFGIYSRGEGPIDPLPFVMGAKGPEVWTD